MKRSFIYTVWLLFFAFIILTLCGKEILSGDESRVAGIAAEMSLTGDWLVPRLNGTPFLEYPPFYYWCTALSYKIFGITDFAAKLPTALAACALLALSYGFARKMRLSPKAALLAPLFLLFSGQFFTEMYRCRVDMMLALFTALAVFAFYCGTEERKTRKKSGWFAVFSLSVACGVGTKGLLGAAFPAGILGIWLILTEYRKKRFSFRTYLIAAAGGVTALVLVGIWYFLLWKQLGGAFLHDALYVNNLGRFSGSQGDHAEKWYYYFVKLPTLFLPWLPLLCFSLWNGAKKAWKESDPVLLLILCMMTVPFAMLSFASAKRVVYLLPLALPAAVLCAWQIAFLPSKLCRTVPYPRTVAALFFAVVIVGFSGIDRVQSRRKNRKESLRPLFETCSQWEKRGYEVTLSDAQERTSGAYYFYLHHQGENLQPDSPLKAKECRIFRSRTQQTKFNDHHGILIRHQ